MFPSRSYCLIHNRTGLTFPLQLVILCCPFDCSRISYNVRCSATHVDDCFAIQRFIHAIWLSDPPSSTASGINFAIFVFRRRKNTSSQCPIDWFLTSSFPWAYTAFVNYSQCPSWQIANSIGADSQKPTFINKMLLLLVCECYLIGEAGARSYVVIHCTEKAFVEKATCVKAFP